MDNLYVINFKSNGEFYKIHIRYNSIELLITYSQYTTPKGRFNLFFYPKGKIL
jgi:hypothetical protein